MKEIIFKEFSTAAGPMPSFSTKVAKELGVNAAITLNSIGTLMYNAHDMKKENDEWLKFQNGKKFVKMSYDQLDPFDLFSKEQIDKNLKKLIKNKYIEIFEYFSEMWFSTFQEIAYIK